jgi:hypothetical protein
MTTDDYTDDQIQRMADEAEAGYDVDAVLSRRRGRPAKGEEAGTLYSLRLEPALRARLNQRAEQETRPAAEVLRTALEQYLDRAS